MYLETFYTREPVPFLNPQTLFKSPKKKISSRHNQWKIWKLLIDIKEFFLLSNTVEQLVNN